MLLERNKLYLILTTACAAGYIWLFLNKNLNLTQDKPIEVCLIKRVTNIPCPSCGSTRSVISLTNGNFVEAFDYNPIGFILAFVMLVVPIWVVKDIVYQTNSLFVYFLKIESYLNKPKYAIYLVLLIVFNWIWNIEKGL